MKVRNKYNPRCNMWKLVETWDRKNSKIGYFRNKHHNCNCTVVIESNDGKHYSEFFLYTETNKPAEANSGEHTGHEYKIPKFVMDFINARTKKIDDEFNKSDLKKVEEASHKMDEDNDCTVKAIALAAGVSYEASHKACALQGRKKGHGIPYFSILRALEDVGGKVSIQLRQHEHRVGGVDNLYVNTCKNKSLDTISRLAKKVGAKRLTFNKLPEVVKIDRNYIVMNHGHAAAVVGGKIIDWSAGSKMLVTELIELK